MGQGLSKLQNEVMDRLFSGESEDAALAAAEISLSIYQRWLKNEKWQQEFQRRIEKCQREAQLLISRYQPVAAAKLISLMDCEKEQTARQACLDVLQMESLVPKTEKDEKTDELGKLILSSEAAAKITKILASGKVEDEQADNK